MKPHALLLISSALALAAGLGVHSVNDGPVRTLNVEITFEPGAPGHVDKIHKIQVWGGEMAYAFARQANFAGDKEKGELTKAWESVVAAINGRSTRRSLEKINTLDFDETAGALFDLSVSLEIDLGAAGARLHQVARLSHGLEKRIWQLDL
jgi:hypothetical protein